MELSDSNCPGLCACGKTARRGQRNCLSCHAAAEKRRRARQKLNLDRLQTALDRVTDDFPTTRAAFDAQIKSRAVIVPCEGDSADITGVVIGFLPNMMLRILDDTGDVKLVPLAKVKADRGRRV